MMQIASVSDAFIPNTLNNCLYHNQLAKKQIKFYLPDCNPEKKFRFFIASPYPIVLCLNNEDSYWNSDSKEIVIPPTPGTDVFLEAVLGKWQVSSNSKLTFR